MNQIQDLYYFYSIEEILTSFEKSSDEFESITRTGESSDPKSTQNGFFECIDEMQSIRESTLPCGTHGLRVRRLANDLFVYFTQKSVRL